jgi:hypothetical protein
MRLSRQADASKDKVRLDAEANHCPVLATTSVTLQIDGQSEFELLGAVSKRSPDDAASLDFNLPQRRHFIYGSV